MRGRAWLLMGLITCAAALTACRGTSPDAGTPFVPPRIAAGHPDLQGIWQVRNTAHWDLQDHTGALNVPAGLGVVVDPPDGTIPYRPEARARQAGELGEPRTVGSDAEVLSRRRAADDVPATPAPDPSDRRRGRDPLGVRAHLAVGAADAARTLSGLRVVDGRSARPLGRRHAGHRDGRLQRPDLARSRRQLSTATR